MHWAIQQPQMHSSQFGLSHTSLAEFFNSNLERTILLTHQKIKRTTDNYVLK